MSVEMDVMNAVISDAGVFPLIDDGGGVFRYYPVQLPQQSKFPSITWQIVSTTRTAGQGSVTLDKGYTGMAVARFSFIVWSDSYVQVLALATALKRVLVRLTLVGSFCENSVANEFDQIEPQRALYQRYIDIMIRFVEEGRDG